MESRGLVRKAAKKAYIKPESEKGKLEKPSLSLWSVLRYSDKIDMIFMGLGTIGCVVDGSSLALTMLITSNAINTYDEDSLSPSLINKFALLFTYLAIGIGFGGFLEAFCWARTGDRQASRLRSKYLHALLWQDVGFFDRKEGASVTSQVVSSLTTDTLTIQALLTDKMPTFLTSAAMFIMSQLAALYLCWRLAIVATPALSLLIIPGLIYGKSLAEGGKKFHKAYAAASGIMEQTLSSIKVVFSYVGEERAFKSFSRALEPTLKLGIRQGLMKGLTVGTVGVVYAIWALQGWYGSILVTENKIKGGNIFNTGVCVVYGGFALMSALSNLRFFMEANAAAAGICKMIERVPVIDSADSKGETILHVKGELEFKDVDFAYPSRPDTLVLKKLSLKVMACQTVGLVGSSGSGKSTVMNLLERFYDPLRGLISLDGINVQSLQLKWLRSQMGLVDQEPVLFATSIKENILFGKQDSSEDEIIQAAKAANAHDFITQLPNGYDTLVGQLGTQMSGGQKQRISIARALIRDPKVLMLDEATSSLDSQSEKAVQDALNQASIGRSTIIIAHRLSTLRNADLIAFISSGQVIESGPHDQLIQNQNGPYSTMVKQQEASMNQTTSLSRSEGENLYSSTSKSEVSSKLTTNFPINNEKSNHMSKDGSSNPSIKWLLEMTAPERKETVLGCIGALCYGAIQPLHGYFLGALLSSYFLDDERLIKSETLKYSFVFLTFAAAASLTSLIQHYYFGVMGERLTKRVRENICAKFLTFETEWFDQEHNSSGALCSRLATDASMVRTLVADRLSLLAQTISGVTLAVILGMALDWNLAIVVIAIQPLIIAAFYVKAITIKSMSVKVRKAQNKSSELASEAVGNHRTIAAYYSQRKVMELFDIAQIAPRKEGHKQSWNAGLLMFISGFLSSATAGVIYWYGGKLLFHGKITYKHVFQIFFILMSTGRIIAETGSTTSDLSKGISALKSVFEILERKSQMDPDAPDGVKPKEIIGDIELKDVEFFYPTRPQQMILNKLSLKVDAGQVVAIVGRSGSGKSTIIKLIERFYDPSSGSVQIDGLDIKCYNLRSLRSFIALVSQEPTLFAGTIQENISYGKEDASEAEIIKAANLANAHEFISSMKDGYNTYCGEKGLQLSGGQKQRIAIARAILRNPSILLLDEATSALDVNSENLVQDALDKTMVGRTCVVVAHRLSTVQKSHKIFVVDSGKIVEEGTHHELIAKGETRTYFEFFKLQQLQGYQEGN